MWQNEFNFYYASEGRHLAKKTPSFVKLETVDMCDKGLTFVKLGGHEISSSEVIHDQAELPLLEAKHILQIAKNVVT